MTGAKLFALFLLVISAVENNGSKTAPELTIKTGRLVGLVETSFSGHEYFSYKGIPFAEPPTNQLRFKPPVDKKPWEGVLDATKDGPACIQLFQFNETIVIGDEACLLLNVYTRQSKDQEKQELKPVLVYIHGGRWLVGSANSKSLSPIYLMDREDFVVVTIQYRLGALGFLSTEDEVAPGNYGLLDQVKALEWVQANIEVFGGDANRVTVMGQSAGAASTHMHFFSPLSKGLIHGGISISGSAINYWANRFDYHMYYAEKQAKVLHCPTESSTEIVECLQKVEAKKLTLSISKMYDLFGGTSAKLPLSVYGPRIDKESPRPFMPASALDLIRKGEVAQIPFMLGVTSLEGAWLMSSFYGEKNLDRLKHFDQNRIKGMNAIGTRFFKEEELDQWISFYLNDQPAANLSQMIPFSEIISDSLFNFECLMAAYFHARQSQAPVFNWQFNFRGLWSFAEEFEEVKNDYKGVAHVDDLRYIFWMPYGPDLSAEEIEVMKRYTGYIAEFVKYGKPTNGDPNKTYKTKWEPYQKGNGQYMVIDTVGKSGMSHDVPFETKERPGRMEFWRKLLKYPENFMDDFRRTKKHSEL